jgi:hypothetical protein
MACLISLGKVIVLLRPPLTFTRAVRRRWLQTMEEARRFLTSLKRKLVRARVNSILSARKTWRNSKLMLQTTKIRVK